MKWLKALITLLPAIGTMIAAIIAAIETADADEAAPELTPVPVE
jgi:hypothetical protein